MNLLLDTHVFLWWITGDDRLSKPVLKAVEDPRNTVFFSAASAWEIAIKARLGRIRFSGDPRKIIPHHISKNGFDILPVAISHALEVASLPAHHKDPFDRLLIAQALVEGIPVVTRDPWFKKYKVETIW